MKTLLTFLTTIFLLTSCDDYPGHSVYEGRQLLIVYKVEKVDNPKYGTFKYAVTDATGKDWTLVTFQKFNIGDTLNISKR